MARRPATAESALPPAFLAELRQVLPPARLLTDTLSRHLYKYDAALEEVLPAAVALPETAAEVAALVRLCARHGVPFVPRGAGTSLSGGSIPAPDCLVLSLARLDRVLEIRPADRCAVVQPGVVNLDLQDALEPRGFFYAPDPSSQLVSTLGGNVGHNAGGPHCLKYGVTSHHVLALELVTPEGELLRLGGRSLEQSGYRLGDLQIGAEGTLGVVTEITCRLLPLPAAVRTVLASFDSLEAASTTVSAVIAEGIIPAALEMLDRPLIEAVERTFPAGYPPEAAAVLLMEVDGSPAALDEELAELRRVCLRHGARDVRTARSEAERAALWKGRKATAAAIANLAPGKISTDVSVPRQVLPQMVARVAETAARHDLLIGNILHAGDGNLHPQIIFDPRDADQMRRVFAAQEEIIRAALDLGGSLTGEHGVGTEKRRYMPLMFSPAELALLGRIKTVWDPAGLCNPGKLLPEEPPEPPAPALSLPAGDFAHAADEVAVRDEAGRLHPYDYEALGKLLALAVREGEPLYLSGAGLHAPPPVERTRVSTLGLHRLLCLDRENLTVTAQAGVRLGELQAALAEAGQWWPVLPPGGPEATLGGILATGRSGPWSARYGRLADLVTAARLVLPGGETLSFGAACMKNVAGYAVERLLVGSQGTLAALVEVTLRTRPLPPCRLTLALRGGPLEALARCGEAILGRLLPAGLDLVNAPAARRWDLPLEGDWLALVALHGRESEVAAHAATVRGLAAEHGLEAQQVPDPRDSAGSAALPAGPGVLNCACAPSACPGLLADLTRLVEELEQAAALSASLAAGTVEAAWPAAIPAEHWPRSGTLCGLLERRGASGTWWSPRGRRLLPSPPAAEARLWRRLKSACDETPVLPELDEHAHA